METQTRDIAQFQKSQHNIARSELKRGHLVAWVGEKKKGGNFKFQAFPWARDRGIKSPLRSVSKALLYPDDRLDMDNLKLSLNARSRVCEKVEQVQAQVERLRWAKME